MKILGHVLVCFLLLQAQDCVGSPLTMATRVADIVITIIKLDPAVKQYAPAGKEETIFKCSGCSSSCGMVGIIGMLAGYALKNVDDDHCYQIAKQKLDESFATLQGSPKEIEAFITSTIEAVSYKCPECNNSLWQVAIRNNN